MDNDLKILLLKITKEADDPLQAQIILMDRLIELKIIRKILFRIKVDYKSLQKELRNSLEDIEKGIPLDITQEQTQVILKNLEPIVTRAYYLAKKLNFYKIEPVAIFLALIEKSNPLLQNILNKSGITLENAQAALVMEYFKSAFIKNKFQPHSYFLSFVPKRRWLNRTWTSAPTPLLDKIGTDLTYLADLGQIGFLINHFEELEQINAQLQKGSKLNFILRGREGSGRTVLIWHLAYLISKDLVPENYFDYRIIQVDLNQLYAYASEEFEYYVSAIFSEAEHASNVILFFPDLDQALIAETTSKIWPYLHRFLRESKLYVIATVTPEGFSKANTKYNLINYFEIIDVQELSEEDSISLLSLEALIYEDQYKIIISPQAISSAVKLAHKFIYYKPLPSSARDLLKETIDFAKNLNLKIIDEEIVGDVFSKITGIPIKLPSVSEKYLLENLEEIIHQRIVDQEYAVKEVCRALRIYRAGIEKKKGPIATFLFIGPTGVGKTELAKTLARIYFGGENQIIRLDLVEFQNIEDIKRLIGSEDGQITGVLTENVLKQPYSLVLLDDFDKAHPQILNLFLPIFDEGYIKDGLGRTIDFSNTLIICTSNALSDYIKEEISRGKKIEEIAPIIIDKLHEIFRTELLNRLSGIIVFKSLSPEDISKIFDILIDEINVGLLQKFGFTLSFTNEAKNKIIELGYNPVFGARELKRTIEKEILGPLSEIIFKEDIKKIDKITVDYQDNFVFITKEL